MAEILGLTTSILLILAATDSSLRTINKIIQFTSVSTADSRLNTLTIRARTEKWKTEEWAKNIARNKTPIEESRLTQVEEIRAQLDETSQVAARRLAEFKRGTTAKSLPQRFSSRYRWDAGGYDDCKDLADLMQALNEALRTLVPPLPSYPGGALTTDESPQPLQRNSFDASLPVPSTPNMEIRNLWQACSSAMDALGSQRRSTDAAFTLLHRRLHMWGSDLTHESTDGIDSLVSSDRRGPLKTYILSQLVEIVVVQEHLLATWSAQEGGSPYNRLEACRATTRVALIGDNVTQLGIERWYALQAEEQSESKSPEDYIEYMQSQVENLFQILPAVRGLRHEDLLITETKDQRVATSQKSNLLITPTTSSGPIPAQPRASDLELVLSTDSMATIDLIEDNVEKIKRIPLPSPLIEKNLRALEEWSIEASLRRGLAQKQDSAEVRKVQEALAAALGNILPTYESNQKSKPVSNLSLSDMTALGELLSTAASQLRFVS